MQRGSATILLIIGLFAILGIGGFYYLNSVHTSPAILIKEPTGKMPGHIIADQTYNNQNLSFEFKYPSNLSVKSDTEDEFNKRGGGDFRKNFTGYVQYQPGKFLGAVSVLDNTNSFDKSSFTVWVFDNPDNLTAEQWYGKYWYYPFVWGDFTWDGKAKTAPSTIATISGQLAKSAVVDYQPGKPQFIYLNNNGKMYLFRLFTDPDKGGEKILSTFKFLNPVMSQNKGTILGKVEATSDVCFTIPCQKYSQPNFTVNIYDSSTNSLAFSGKTDTNSMFTSSLPVGSYYFSYKVCPGTQREKEAKLKFAISADKTTEETFDVGYGPC